jgi:hypothetical protein
MLQLVNSLSGVICLGIHVLGTKVPPLEAVDGTKVADFAVGETEVVEEFARPIAVPDLDAGFAEGEGGCFAFDEPQELEDDCSREDSFCGEEGQDWAAVWTMEGEFKRSWGKY